MKKEYKEELYAIHKYEKHKIYKVSLQDEKVIFTIIPYYEEWWDDLDLRTEEYDPKTLLEELPLYTFIKDTYDSVLRNYMFRKDVKTGWISFDGEFYPCDQFEHESFARLYLEKTSQELENGGWLRIEKNDDYNRYIESYYENPEVMTNAQERTLVSLGFLKEDYKDWMVID